MELAYLYTKQRESFGRYCDFRNVDAKVLESIPSTDALENDYVRRRPMVTRLDTTPHMSEHEVNTERLVTKHSSMRHVEGGWPKDVDPAEQSDVQRFRKKAEKDDDYKQAVKSLGPVVDRALKQNNTINIYQDYFAHMGEAATTEQPSAKGLAVFRDPEPVKRTVSQIDWHPESPQKMAACYCILNFQDPKFASARLPANSYIWDVVNPNTPETTLKPASPLVCMRYNPKSVDQLVAGSYNGLISFFDLRKSGAVPAETSIIEHSHHDPVYDVFWISSKTGNQCCSVSTDGWMLWWDIRHLAQPTHKLLLTDKDGLAFGGSSMEYNTEAGPTKYLVGTEQGAVLSVNLRNAKQNNGITLYDTGAGKHHGPVCAIQRNPTHNKFFLTIGDWTARLWCEDLKTPIMSTIYHDSYVTAGCWSPTRAGVFFVTRMDGVVDIWDFFYRQNEVAYSHKVGDVALSSVSVQGNAGSGGKLVAVGDCNGMISLMELSDGLAASQPNEKAAINGMFERETKREKNLEAKEKELRRKKATMEEGAADDRGGSLKDDKMEELLRTVDANFLGMIKEAEDSENKNMEHKGGDALGGKDDDSQYAHSVSSWIQYRQVQLMSREMTKGKQHEMPVIRENEDGMLSSGDGVATEGEEEEEDVSPMRNSTAENQEEHEPPHSFSDEGEKLTPYVAKCYGHLETLRKRKREQEEQVETLVEETFGQIEAIMQELMRGLQERHAASHAQFEATESKLMRSLRAHNRMEKKLKMIAAILLREDDSEHELQYLPNRRTLRMEEINKAIASETQMEEDDNNVSEAEGDDANYSDDQVVAEINASVVPNDEEMPWTGADADDVPGGNVEKEDDVEMESKLYFASAKGDSTGTRIEDDEDSENGDEDSDDTMNDKNPLVQSVLPTTRTFDKHIQILINRRNLYVYFDNWKRKLTSKATVTRIREAFEQLLPRLMGARDYVGAAKLLGVMYHRFTVSPALCIEASLEILRRQPDYRNDLLSFYEAALEVKRIDKMLILKEMWLFHIVHGEFYEAYHLYQDKIQQREEAEDDARLFANFGILCYWLMFVESKELRDMLKREDMEYEDEEDDDMNANDFGASESIESVIESNYLFKTPIGVHILYQHASNALRRAVALNPSSAMFVEYYVQLLVLVGDIQPACDYLEAFFYMNPEDPHASRMLASFLGCYFPDSVDAQVAVFSRWMKNDPSCNYALEKMLEFSSAGAVSSFVLTKALVEALDTCGSDLYVTQNPDVALTLWRNLAELLAAMDEDEFLLDQVEGGETDPSQQVTLADMGAQHLWWKRAYFSRPSTIQEVIAVSKQDSSFLEVSIYRAAVADRLFPGHLQMTQALLSAMTSPNVAFSQEHMRLFRSFFPSVPNTRVETAEYTPFSSMPFIQVVVDADNDRKDLSLPIFKGSMDALHVIERKSIVAREVLGDKADVVATRAGETGDVDPQFVEELYEALEYEVGYSSTIDHRKRKFDVISTTSAPGLLIPGFVRMVEEELYNHPDAYVGHIYSMLHQKLRRSDMLMPTSKVVTCCVDFFRNRMMKNQEHYGHCGILMRYENFIAMYMNRQRAKGIFKVSSTVAKAAIEEMKRVLPSPHPHFPDESIVEETMRSKTPVLARQRRLRLMSLKKTLKSVLKKIGYVDEKTFVEAVYSVCKQNWFDGLVSRVDIARTLQIVLPLHYYRMLQSLNTMTTRLLTSPEIRKNYTPEDLYQQLKKRQTRTTLNDVKALFWVERYEALYGPIMDIEENSDSSSDSSIDSDSSSDISTDTDDSSSDTAEENQSDRN